MNVRYAQLFLIRQEQVAIVLQHPLMVMMNTRHFLLEGNLIRVPSSCI